MKDQTISDLIAKLNLNTSNEDGVIASVKVASEMGNAEGERLVKLAGLLGTYQGQTMGQTAAATFMDIVGPWFKQASEYMSATDPVNAAHLQDAAVTQKVSEGKNAVSMAMASAAEGAQYVDIGDHDNAARSFEIAAANLEHGSTIAEATGDQELNAQVADVAGTLTSIISGGGAAE